MVRFVIPWLLGALPFLQTLTPLGDFALISWAGWPGHSKGVIVTVLDLIALATIAVLPRASDPVPRQFRASFLLYFFWAVLASVASGEPMASAFYLWELCTSGLVFYAVFRAAGNRESRLLILGGFASGLIVEAGICIWQRFALGDLQASGSFVHQNSLGIASNLAWIPVLGALIAGSGPLRRLMWCGVAAGVLCSVFTVSRATIGLGAIGGVFLLIWLGSSSTRVRTGTVVLVVFAIVVVATPIVFGSFQSRFEERPEPSSYDEREAFERAALMMASSAALGVGPNNYVIAANLGGYNDIAGVAARSDSRSTSVHNLYLLVAAESGYISLLLLLGMFLSIIVTIGAGILSGPEERVVERAIFVSIGVAFVHSLFEWVLATGTIQSILAVNVAIAMRSLVGATSRKGGLHNASRLKWVS